MKRSVIEWARSIWSLLGFVFWYLLAVSGFLYLLPKLAVYLQGQYDALNSLTRLLAVLGLLLVIAIWQIREIRAQSVHSAFDSNE